MNDNQSNYSWREWSKYVLLTLERFEKLIEGFRSDIAYLKERCDKEHSELENLKEELADKADKSDIKMIDYKVAVITGIVTFIITLVAKYVFDIMTKTPTP